MLNYKKFEDYDNYIIFKTGKIFSLNRNRFLKPCPNSYGYLTVGLSKKGRKSRRHVNIHRLLGLLYIPNPENKPTVDHINQNKMDNRLTNLKWATQKEQVDNRKELFKNNTSGFKGVFFRDDGREKKWSASIYVNGKKSLRGFGSKEEAIAYRREMEIKYLKTAT